MLITPNESAHYYSYSPQTGEISAAYDKGLREARVEKLFVSPTTLEKQTRANPSLDIWKQNQVMKAVLANPRLENEPEKDYAMRVRLASDSIRDDAANFGERIHKAIEDYPQQTFDIETKPFIDLFGPWYDSSFSDRWHSEIMLAHPRIGVAGRCDFIGVHKQFGPCLVDWKTKAIKDLKKKPEFYDSWVRQLAFYRQCFFLKTGNLLPIMSVVIGSVTPMEPIAKLWTTEETEHAYKEFLATAWLWFSDKNFWPAGRWEPIFDV